MNENKKFFDVADHHKIGSQPTSRPIIVGHHPTMPDPMLSGERLKTPHTVDLSPAANPVSGEADNPAAHVNHNVVPNQSDQLHTTAPVPASSQPMMNDVHPTPPTAKLPTAKEHPNGSGELHVPAGRQSYNHKPRTWAWVLLTLIVLVLAYLAVDAKTDVLPFHIFNHTDNSPSPSTNSNSPASQSNANESTLPTGFTQYQPTGTPIIFAYPAAWGTAKTTNDPGYTERGTGKKSDGVHAYLVNFSTNKDIQVAITSSKYLPASRGALYYDFLQWCYGVPDGKFYKQRLMFTTTAGIDKPSNAPCDQGPLSDAAALIKDKNNAIIIQAKTKDASGTALGDLYTANLNDINLPVFRVKDAKMTNSADIKILIATIRGSSTSQ